MGYPAVSDNGRREVKRGGAAVFTVRWPFKRAPCFHWHGDVRALKDSSLSSLNSEGNGPGRESCFRRETFLHCTKLGGTLVAEMSQSPRALAVD